MASSPGSCLLPRNCWKLRLATRRRCLPLLQCACMSAEQSRPLDFTSVGSSRPGVVLCEPFGLPAETSEPVYVLLQALARALAKITGHTVIRSRSLLTAHEDFTTLQFVGDVELDRPGFVFGFLRRKGVPETTVEEVRL